MSTTETGRAAEAQAAAYLEAAGFIIIEQNWRNRWCELDIIARQGNRIHIIEVKYRRSAQWGSGVEYINYDKIQRLKRTALAYVQAHRHRGTYQIDVISVEGSLAKPRIEYLPNAISD